MALIGRLVMVIVRRRVIRAALQAIVAVAIAAGELHAQTPGFSFSLDDRGRLSKVVNLSTGECAVYSYDVIGNITAIVRQASCVNAPVITTITPGDSPGCYVVTGQSLLGATITVDTPGVSVTGLRTTDTRIDFCLSTQAAVCSLSANVTVTTLGGSSAALPAIVSGGTFLNAGVQTAGNIGAVGETDRFCFALPAARRVEFQAVSATVQPCIRLLGAGGTPIPGAQACSTTSSTRLNLNLAAGSYLAEVFDNGNDSTGAYTLIYHPIVVTLEAVDATATEARENTGLDPVYAHRSARAAAARRVLARRDCDRG